ncbi:MAG: DUF3287 domain-containing protein [Trichocoleus desertorum ATA4-8-CV12]|jgi:predicted  nucleic acid-binding Zn-ribbon protein|nr:DUF3287 domain-containing protein [Trichocoleus desertorum ATA4-8-CV12]
MPQRPSRPNIITPKISTMPRQQTEATVYLDVYKLVVERRRLEQERQKIEQRSQQINQRMTQLDQEIAALETTLQQLRSKTIPEARPLPAPTSGQPEPFDMLFLEY